MGLTRVRVPGGITKFGIPRLEQGCGLGLRVVGFRCSRFAGVAFAEAGLGCRIGRKPDQSFTPAPGCLESGFLSRRNGLHENPQQ